MAYLTAARRSGPVDDPRLELGAVGHGPQGPMLAARMVEQIRTWAADRSAEPWLAAWPLDSPPDRFESGVRVIPKPSSRLVIGYGSESGDLA